MIKRNLIQQKVHEREAALSVSEIRYRRLFESAKDGILILDAETGMILDVNPFLIEMLGYSEDQFIEKAIWEIGFFKDIVANRDKFLELQQMEYVRYEDLPLETADGRNINVEFVSNVYLVDKKKVIQCNIRDITERKRAEKEIAMLAHSLKSVNECVSITDLDDKILFVNELFLKTYGYEINELIGKHISIVSSQNNEQEQVKEISTSTILGGWQGELLNKRSDGSEFPIFLSTTTIKDKESNILGLIGVATDISERKRAEKELIVAKERAEESDNLKTSFLNNISHEIRTPFNGILGFLSLLQDDDMTANERDEYISIINKSAYRLMNTINDIVEISQIQAGQIKLSVTKTNIRKLTSEVYSHFKSEAESNGLKFYIKNDLPNDLENIHTDSIKLNAILSVLILNAIKFTKTGSIQFGISLIDTVVETQGRASLQIQFSIKDTGVGISKSKQHAIFERFMQADGSNTRSFEGSGLGLAIAKAYVEMLGGKIWVESEEGEGSVFYFTIPYRVEPEEKDVNKIVVSDKGSQNQHKPLKILIAEDDEESAILLALAIKVFSKEVIKVRTGVEAIEACRNYPDIDMILMDIKMPDMNGHEATRQIRQFNRDVIIIAQTAYALTGDQERAIEAGCNDYISKPIKKEQFMELMKKYFKK
ncbi:MAG: PAS domain S-box protein [Bacteroidia bacterium]|nr:PAS domain S-box protein [Bacteroidia bacterium]